MELEQLIEEPIQVWKIKFDHASVHQTRALAFLNELPFISHCQLNHLINYRNIPNDSLFDRQWQYLNIGGFGGMPDADIDMDLAWDIATGGLTSEGDSIVICIIDDGIDPNHDDLVNVIWKNHNEIPGNDIDDDANGYIDDYNGWNAYQDNDNIFSGGGHGTPVAGIAGAQGNNGTGVSGINWNSKLMIVTGGGDEAAALEAYAYPYQQRKIYNETNGQKGAFVVVTNASWGVDFGQANDAPIWCNFYDSLGMIGILNCGATINGNVNVDIQGDLPTGCESDFMISVTNLNRQNEKVESAGYGLETIDLGAYGANSFTVALGNNYDGFGGTSGATPHVAGVVALIYSINCDRLIELAKERPEQAARDVRQYILSGVKANESLSDITVTGGCLNAFNALSLAVDDCGACASPQNVSLEEDFFSSQITWEIDPMNINTTVNLRYRKKGEADWNLIENLISPYEISDLEICTSYELQFQSICENSNSNFIISHFIETLGCCPIVESLNGDYETSNNTIELDWNMLNEDANFILEYKNKKETIWDTIITTDLNFVLNDLEECSAYQFRITAQCQFMDAAPSQILTISSSCGNCTALNYCERSGDNEEEWIEVVKLGQIDNISGADPNGYGNFQAQSIAEIAQGSEQIITIIPGFSNSPFEEYYTAWIDWDQNGIFDTSEYIINTLESSTETVSQEFTVPDNIPEGFTRMRIIMSFRDTPDPCNSGSINFGEVEDYCIKILEAPSIVKTELSKKISIYPIPADDFIIIESVKKIISFEIFSSDGRTLLIDKSWDNRNKINISKLNNTYNYIKLYFEDGSFKLKKFVKI